MSNEPIEIVQVANGFLVRPARNDVNCVVSEDSTNVFQSFTELIGWMRGHFNFRCTVLIDDGEDK